MISSVLNMNYDRAERRASVMENSYIIIHSIFKNIESHLGDSSSDVLKKRLLLWSGVWGGYGKIDEWKVTGGTQVTSSDIEWVEKSLGTRMSCRKIADKINKSEIMKKSCFKVTCEVGSSASSEDSNGWSIFSPTRSISNAIK